MSENTNITMQDIFQDSRFDKIIEDILNNNYKSRTVLKEGLKYKRNGFDALHDLGIFNPRHIKEEFQRLLNHSSRLSARERQTISWIINRATATYYINYVKNGNKEESGNESPDNQ